MKYDNNSDNIKDMFKNTFGSIDASEEFKKNIKLSVEKSIDSKSKKASTFKLNYKFAAIAACFILVIFITNFSTIKAGLMNVYEYFINNIDSQYATNTKDYAVDIDREIEIEKDFSVKINQAVFLEQGMEFNYEFYGDVEKYNICGFEIDFQKGGKTYKLYPDMILKFKSGYLASSFFEDSLSNVTFNDFLQQELDLNVKLQYTQNTSNDFADLKEKQFKITLIPQKTFTPIIYKASDKAIYQDEYVKVNSIKINSCYIEVNYKVLFEYDDSEKLFLLSLSSNNEELVALGGSGDESSYNLYYGLLDEGLTEIKITPVFYKYGDKTFNYTNLNEGKVITLN